MLLLIRIIYMDFSPVYTGDHRTLSDLRRDFTKY